ncbi:MAG: FecR domain-containing protein [Planctomycetes bacterium]|nr:FecR domain-containing protein [Planctomycetota bacterium]
MIAEHERLIADYLAGRASEDDLRQVDELVLRDDAFRRSLLLEASMDVHLRQTLSGAALGLPATEPATRQWPNQLALAAALALAVIGWAMAAYLHRQNSTDRRHIANLESQVAQLQAAADRAGSDDGKEGTQTSVAAEHGQSPEIIDTRGLVLLLPEQQGEDAMSVSMGSAIPEGRALWTCPWGGADTRFSDGARVSLSRSTTAVFTERDGKRRIILRGGVLSVERHGDSPAQEPTVVETAGAVISMERGLATIVIDEGRTIVEIGSGKASVTRAADGTAIDVLPGQYVVVAENEEFRAVKGRLQMTPTVLKPQPDEPKAR